MARPTATHATRWSEAVINRVAATSRRSSKAVEALRLVEAGRTQADAAREVGVQAATVSKWVKQADRLHGNPATRASTVLTEDEIALARARIARESLAAGDFKSALEAMRDEARRQQLESDLVRQESVTILAHLHSIPPAERRQEILERAQRLGLSPVLNPAPLPSEPKRLQHHASADASAQAVASKGLREPQKKLPALPPGQVSGNVYAGPPDIQPTETDTFHPAPTEPA